MSTSTELIGQLATTSGQFITELFPLLWFFLGGVIALFAIGLILKGFRKGIKNR